MSRGLKPKVAAALDVRAEARTYLRNTNRGEMLGRGFRVEVQREG